MRRSSAMPGMEPLGSPRMHLWLDSESPKAPRGAPRTSGRRIALPGYWVRTCIAPGVDPRAGGESGLCKVAERTTFSRSSYTGREKFAIGPKGMRVEQSIGPPAGKNSSLPRLDAMKLAVSIGSCARKGDTVAKGTEKLDPGSKTARDRENVG